MHNTTPKPRYRRFPFGPGTVLAVAAGLFLVWNGQAERTHSLPNVGRVVYEADAQGQMRRVNAPSPSPAAPLPRLWKPEPGWLLESDRGLPLNAQQRQQIQKIAASWQREKALWLADMEQAATDINPSKENTLSERGTSLIRIRQSMSDYSALSRQYNARRAHAWAEATALLTAEQRRKVDALAQATEKTR